MDFDSKDTGAVTGDEGNALRRMLPVLDDLVSFSGRRCARGALGRSKDAKHALYSILGSLLELRG